MKKKLLASVLVGLSMILGCVSPAMADSRKVVTLGADLTEEQKNTMMRYFGVSYDGVDLIYINNTDERNHLGHYVPLEQIGNYTYSCALVAPTSSGGIQVKTANLDWVTCNMIATTLSTCGVTNCQVVAAAPFKVSGTGALTGVIMAYETASQQTLDPVKKDLANQELVATGNLANEVGQSKATAIMNETKIEVVENNITNVEEITNIVNNVSNEYGVSVNADQSQVIAELMQKIAEQEYDIVQLKATLDTVQANVAGDAGASVEEQEAAEQKARESQMAAEQAAAAAQIYGDQYDEMLQEGTVVVPETVETEAEENILENTDVSALETEGAVVNEGDTTTTVLEQEAAQSEVTEDFGIPEATTDGTVADPGVVVESEAPAADENGVVMETEAPAVDENGIVVETEASAEDENGVAVETPETDEFGMPAEETTEAMTEAVPEVQPEQLAEEDRILYDEVKMDVDTFFATTVLTNEDASYTMYLTEEAAKKVPETLEKYLLNLLAKGSDAVAMEEAANVEIPQNIMEETASYAADKNYEDADMRQLDKYVRRFVFKDSEALLADSMLEESDKVFLYEQIMMMLEKAYKVEPAVEETEEFVEETAAPAEEIPMEAAPAEEIPVDAAPIEEIPEDTAPAEEVPAEAAADEFADFEVQEGTF